MGQIKQQTIILLTHRATPQNLLTAKKLLLKKDHEGFTVIFWGYKTPDGYCLCPGANPEFIPKTVIEEITIAVIPEEFSEEFQTFVEAELEKAFYVN